MLWKNPDFDANFKSTGKVTKNEYFPTKNSVKKNNYLVANATHFVFIFIGMETRAQYNYYHSWASAFRHPVSQSGTGAFRYRTGFPYSSTGQVPASADLFIPVPDWQDADQSSILALKKHLTNVKKVHTSCMSILLAAGGKGHYLDVPAGRK